MVKPESVIATLINIAAVYLSMNVNEKEIKRIRTGQTVTFTVDAYGDETFRAAIRRLTPVLDMKTRTVEIKAELQNPGYRLLPGCSRAPGSRPEPGRSEYWFRSPTSREGGRTGEDFLVRKDIAFKQKAAPARIRRHGRNTRSLRENDVIVSTGLGRVYDGMKLSLGAGKTTPASK